MKGLSERNFVYMQTFASSYPYFPFTQAPLAKLENAENQEVNFTQASLAQLSSGSTWQSPLAKITWYHHITLLDKVQNVDERLFYIAKTIENGWSRNVLVHQIESHLYERQGKVIANFENTLPPPQSDLARESFKSPYLFDFLAMGDQIQERELEKALIAHIRKFMLELGKGFAYVGNQFHIEVSDKDYFMDLLFFNYNLNCFVIFELKVGEFKPEFAGKLNFYVNTIDEKLRGPNHQPTIGILLCKTSDKTVIEYALRGMTNPLGISGYELSKALPNKLKADLPTIEELESEINREYEELKTPSQKRMESLKEKLSGLKQGEIKQKATIPILQDIFSKSLMPLFQSLLKKMEDFKDLFMSCNYYWLVNGKNITDINECRTFCKEEGNLKSIRDFSFSYELHGLKKAGIETFDTGIQLNYIVEDFWYGFSLVNYNNQQAFVKKLYPEQLSKADIELITDTAFNSVMENIEQRITK